MIDGCQFRAYDRHVFRGGDRPMPSGRVLGIVLLGSIAASAAGQIPTQSYDVEKNAQLLEFKCAEFTEDLIFGNLRRQTDI